MKFVHKIGLGILVGLILFGVIFVGTYGLVTANNAIAITAQINSNAISSAINNSTILMPIVMPFDPPWAIPMLLGFVGFFIPIAGIISIDFDERENETEQTKEQPKPT